VEDLAAANSARKRSGRNPDPGQVAAVVFHLLDARKNLREIVEDLALEPERVRAL
jgi:hypothetical protein